MPDPVRFTYNLEHEDAGAMNSCCVYAALLSHIGSDENQVSFPTLPLRSMGQNSQI